MLVFWKYVKKYKGTLALALVLAAINQFFSLLDPQLFRILIDNYVMKAAQLPKDEVLKGAVLILIGIVGVALISRIAKNFQDYYVNVITQRTGTAMYAKSVSHTFSLPYHVFEDQRSGEVLQKLQKARIDTQAIISSFINVVFLSFIGISFVLIYAFTVNWIIGAAYVMIIPILGVFAFLISKKIKNAQKNIVQETSALAGSTTETLRNVELVKSLGLEHQEIKRLNNVNEQILTLELKKIKLIRKVSFSQGTLINFLRVALLFLMLWLSVEGNISLGEFFSLYIYSFFVFSPLSEFGNIASQYQEAKASNEQLDTILRMKPEKKPANAIELDTVKEITFEHVGFTYSSGDKPSLKDVSLSLKAGQTVAFVGPSGSGKSTMVKLLVGLYQPSSGTITFNNISSDKIDFDQVRRRIGLVAQETQLFAGTIRDNLLFVNPKATDEECLEVLKLASVANIIERGQQGLDTKIGEGGIKISGGERQRLAIARALLRNPELIIFDEATSSLDSITEKAITQTIQNIIQARPHCVIVLVAHRLSTIAHAQTIFVLERGSIVEQGNHEKLLQQKGLYAAFWRQQSGNGEE